MQWTDHIVSKALEEGQRLRREAHGQWFRLGKARDRDGMLDPRGIVGRRNGEGRRDFSSPTPPPYLPFYSIHISIGAGRRHSTHDGADDAGHAMQVVNATCVLDPQPGLQEWLDRGHGCYSGPELWQGRGEARILEAPNTRKPRILQPPAPSLGTPLLSGTQRPPGFSSPQSLAWGPHRQVHKTQGGDNATDEANDEGAVRHEHHFSGRSHGHPSCERGVLDVHLGRAGGAGRSSVLSQSPHQDAVCGGCWRWEAEMTPRASRKPADRRGPQPGLHSRALCTWAPTPGPPGWPLSAGTNRHTCVGPGEPSWQVCTFPVALRAPVRMSHGRYTHVC